MAGVPVVEVAALEQVPPGTVAARLSRARRVVGDALADVVPATPVSDRPLRAAGLLVRSPFDAAPSGTGLASGSEEGS